MIRLLLLGRLSLKSPLKFGATGATQLVIIGIAFAGDSLMAVS